MIIVLYVICFYLLNVLRITAISYVNKFIYALKRSEVSTAGSCCLGSVKITKGKWCPLTVFMPDLALHKHIQMSVIGYVLLP